MLNSKLLSNCCIKILKDFIKLSTSVFSKDRCLELDYTSREKLPSYQLIEWLGYFIEKYIKNNVVRRCEPSSSDTLNRVLGSCKSNTDERTQLIVVRTHLKIDDDVKNNFIKEVREKSKWCSIVFTRDDTNTKYYNQKTLKSVHKLANEINEPVFKSRVSTGRHDYFEKLLENNSVIDSSIFWWIYRNI